MGQYLIPAELSTHQGMGDFNAYQLLLNLSYSKVLNFSESDFVVAGPGARSGILKMFGASLAQARSAVRGLDAEVMYWLQENQNEHFERLGLQFSGLGPQKLPMQLCDIEHTLCEVDKYARIAHPTIGGLKGRTQIRTSANFRPSTSFEVRLCLPKAWGHPDRNKVRIRPGSTKTVQKRYVVDSIVEHREDSQDFVEYRVHWLGYSDDQDTWEPEDELRKDAPGVIEAYLQRIGM
jgi:hypothetical protein